MTKPSAMLYVITVSYLVETYFKHRSGYKYEDFVGNVAFESIFLLLCLWKEVLDCLFRCKVCFYRHWQSMDVLLHSSPSGNKGHPFYQTKFQMCWDSKILVLVLSRETTPLIRPLFHCRRGGLIRKKLQEWCQKLLYKVKQTKLLASQANFISFNCLSIHYH